MKDAVEAERRDCLWILGFKNDRALRYFILNKYLGGTLSLNGLIYVVSFTLISISKHRNVIT